MSGELFTLIFIILLAGSGERIDTVRSKESMSELECKQRAVEDQKMIVDYFLAAKGMKVELIPFCVPEERKA